MINLIDRFKILNCSTDYSNDAVILKDKNVGAYKIT